MASIKARTMVWRILKFFFYPIFFILGPVKSHGYANIKKKGPYLIICNHPSLFDPILLFFFAPRPIIFIGAAEIFKIPGINSMARFFNAIPVERGKPSSIKIALLKAIQELKNGEIVALFPEGETSPEAHLRKLNKGFLYIAKHTDVPIQCAIVKNTSRVIPYKKYIPRPSFKTLKLIWGQQFHLADYESEELFLGTIQAHFHQILTEEKTT